jgi:sulfoxide reductase heme-binding subunit YedZ
MTGQYWMRRSLRHAAFTAASFLITWLAFREIPGEIHHRVSMSSAYAALAFLALSLCLGPWNVLSRRPNPVSFDFRRDAGIWAGLLAVFHTCVGLTVHLRGRMWMYFLRRLHPPAIQNSTFGFANYTGLVAALLFAMLLAISNDWSLRSLGMHKWKSWQRWTYAAAALTIVHAIAFQIVEKRRTVWLVLFGAIVCAVTALQSAGYVRRHGGALR